MLRILLLADAYSSHTSKWVNSLTEKNISIKLFSLSAYNKSDYNSTTEIVVVDFSKTIKKKRDGNWTKILYLSVLNKIKRLIIDFRPDILHAHSASSYGFLGALTGFHPYFISAWGSDIFLFPQKSFIHKFILKYSLHQADRIFSSSKAMAKEIQKYSNKNIDIINFGVDSSVFRPMDNTNSPEELIVGTVKSLDYNYGTKFLIIAFKLLTIKYPQVRLKLYLVGGGGMEKEIKAFTKEIGLIDMVVFTGRIPYKQIHKYHNRIDIVVFPSVSESFGVSVLEASSCQKPVIGSNIGGLPEVIVDNETGLLFESGNVNDLTDKIELLILNPELRTKMGKAGRVFVKKNYEWDKNVLEMVSIYNVYS